jgi:DNA-directed RNA polymerase subunit L
MPTITVSTTEQVKISPKLLKQLRTELATFSSLKTDLKLIEARMDVSKAAIETIREETDQQTIQVDGYSITLVAPIRKKFNPKRFVALGGDLSIYNQAVEDVTSRPYTKISVPGAKADDE